MRKIFKIVAIYFSVRTLVPLWEKYWSLARSTKDSPSEKKSGIFLVLVKCFWSTFFVGGLYQLIYVLLQFASPQILGLIISFVQSQDPEWQGYLYTILFAIVALSAAIAGMYQNSVLPDIFTIIRLICFLRF